MISGTLDYKQIAIDYLKSWEGQASHWLGETAQNTEKGESSPFSVEELHNESHSHSWWRTDLIEITWSEIVGQDLEDSNLTIVYLEANLTSSCYPSRDGSRKAEQVNDKTSYCVWIDQSGTAIKAEDGEIDGYDYELQARIDRLLESKTA